MKHLKKFEDADYMDMLASQKRSREDFDKSEEERIEQLRKQNVRKSLKDENPRISDVEIERKEIIQKVIDGLTSDLNNNPGYQSFKEELLAFLDEFPKE